MSNDRIVKLVFIRIDSGNTGAPRKAVVPLVEGSDFAQFLGRVRRRLGLPDGTSLELLDAATGSVNSIERLIEVDEGVTLDVRSSYVPIPSPMPPTPASASSTPSCSSATPTRGPTHRPASSSSITPIDASYCSPSSSAVPECRLHIPPSTPGAIPFPYADGRDADEGESGALKYRKRRGTRRWPYAIALICLLVALALYILEYFTL